MNKKSLLIFALIMVFVGGAFVVFKKKWVQSPASPAEISSSNTAEKRNTEITTDSDWKQQISKVETFDLVDGKKGYVWFPIPELGVKVQVKTTTAKELVYRTKKEGEITTAEFTTEKLLEISKKLYGSSYYKDEGYQCSLGSFVVYQNVPDTFMVDEKNEYMRSHGTKISNAFIAFYSPQSPCITNSEKKDIAPADKVYEENIVGSWWGKSTSSYSETQGLIENIQESVKTIQ